MSASRGKKKNASRGSGQLVAVSTKTGTRAAKSGIAYQDELRRLIRLTWPECTAKFLAATADISVRQAERVMARQKKISFDLFWALMENDQFGARFHWAILDHLTARWTPAARRDREFVQIENEQRALNERKQKMQKLLMETTE